LRNLLRLPVLVAVGPAERQTPRDVPLAILFGMLATSVIDVHAAGRLFDQSSTPQLPQKIYRFTGYK
jgi:hypothetical protein